MNATGSDAHYRLIMGNRPDLFWKLHEANKPANFYSKEFKDIMTLMLAHDPLQRPSIAEIRNHEWCNGPIPTSDEIKEEFSVRNDLLALENYKPNAESPIGSPDPST